MPERCVYVQLVASERGFVTQVLQEQIEASVIACFAVVYRTLQTVSNFNLMKHLPTPGVSEVTCSYRENASKPIFCSIFYPHPLYLASSSLASCISFDPGDYNKVLLGSNVCVMLTHLGSVSSS